MNIENAEEFSLFYQDALRIYANDHFYATAIPRRSYFWGSAAVAEVLHEHLKNNGKMTRVFLLNNLDELQDPEVIEVMTNQAEIGINVKYIEKSALLRGHSSPFMITENRTVGWRVHTTVDERVTGFLVTGNTHDLTDMWGSMRKIISNPSCEDFKLNVTVTASSKEHP